VGQLLLGSLITLAITAVVQIFIIPRVLTRDRRRERWERDVIELHALLRDELPDMIVAARSSAERYRRAMQFPALSPAAGLTATVDQIRVEASEDARDMLDVAKSANLLEKRIRLVNRRESEVDVPRRQPGEGSADPGADRHPHEASAGQQAERVAIRKAAGGSPFREYVDAGIPAGVCARQAFTALMNLAAPIAAAPHRRPPV